MNASIPMTDYLYGQQPLVELPLAEFGGYSTARAQADQYTSIPDGQNRSRLQELQKGFNKEYGSYNNLLNKAKTNDITDIRTALTRNTGNVTVPTAGVESLRVLENAQKFSIQMPQDVATRFNVQTTRVDLKLVVGELLDAMNSPNQQVAQAAEEVFNLYRGQLANNLRSLGSQPASNFARVLGGESIDAAKNAVSIMSNNKQFVRLNLMAATSQFDDLARARMALGNVRAYTSHVNPLLDMFGGEAVNPTLGAMTMNASDDAFRAMMTVVRNGGTVGELGRVLGQSTVKATRVGWQTFMDIPRMFTRLGRVVTRSSLKSAWQNALIGGPLGVFALGALSFLPGGGNVIDMISGNQGLGAAIQSRDAGKIAGEVVETGAIFGAAGFLSGLLKAPLARAFSSGFTKLFGSGLLSRIPFLAGGAATGFVGLGLFAATSAIWAAAPQIVNVAKAGLKSLSGGNGNDNQQQLPTTQVANAQTDLNQIQGVPDEFMAQAQNIERLLQG